MLKIILSLVLFATINQGSASENPLRPISCQQAYSLSKNLLIYKSIDSENPGNFTLNLEKSIDLKQLKAFDFWYTITEDKKNYFEGVLQHIDDSIEYVRSRNCNLIQVDSYCDTHKIDSLLRNGIFYLGNNTSLIQDQNGSVVHDSPISQPPAKITLFEKFKKITSVAINDGFIVLKTDNSQGKPCIAYNPVRYTKHIDRIFYPLLEVYYYEKHPWKKLDLELKNDNDIKINQAGDLVAYESTFSCWISVCEKKIFNKVIMNENFQKNQLLYLESADHSNNTYAFNFKNKKFYYIENTPSYHEYNINQWFDSDLNESDFKMLKQSLLGYYFGAYLVILKTFFTHCKNYFLNKQAKK